MKTRTIVQVKMAQGWTDVKEVNNRVHGFNWIRKNHTGSYSYRIVEKEYKVFGGSVVDDFDLGPQCEEYWG